MFGKRAVIISMLALALICVGAAAAKGTEASPAAGLSQIGTAFTYQGQLLSSGTLVSDTCDFQFSLWDAAGSGTPPTGGNQVGSSQPAPSIPVSNGLFAVRLDFGSGIFTGEGRWLQTVVRCPAGSGTYTTLAPRQALAPVPYAMFSQDLSLPFQKGVSSPDNAFEVRNSGGVAINAESSGSDPALLVFADGTGDAAFLSINGPANGSTVVNARTVGTGLAASFRIENPLNTHSALAATTNGSGNAGSFNASGSGNAVSAWTTGSGRAINATSQGTNDVMFLSIDNPNNPGSLINAKTIGTGIAAHFAITNPLNSMPTLHVTTAGSGNAGTFNTSGAGNAVDGFTSGSGWAGYFVATGSGNGVRISAPTGNQGLNVVGGSKNAVVATSEGARLLYTEEATEVWFADYGFGRLTDGSVFVTIDPFFAETVNLTEPYHVFVQAYGDAELYVSQRTPLGFEVRLRAGDPSVEFSYRLVATRRGYEGKRLEHAVWADNDPNLYPAQPSAPQNGGVR